MESIGFINVVLLLYLVSVVLYIVSCFRWKSTLGKVVVGFIALCAILQTVELGYRWVVGGHPPLSGMYDSLMLFGWALAVSYLAFLIFHDIRTISIFILSIEIIFIGYANLQDKAIQPLVPVLKSNWLVAHVFVYMLGYGMMTIAFFTALGYYFYSFGRNRRKLETARTLDEITYKIVSIGFPLITLGLITGAVWAKQSWGDYWGWDPKETSALITWCIYAIYLHTRFVRSWRSKSNFLVILGFAAVLGTFIFLKYLPSAKDSLHVY